MGTRRGGVRAILVLAALCTMAVSTATDARPRRVHRHRVVRVHPHFHVGFHVVVHPARPLPHPIVVGGVPAGSIDFDVEPEDTQVFVDGTYRGTVDQFDDFPRTLHLAAGRHQVALKAPGGEELWTESVKVVAGQEVRIDLELEEP
jgi:hypothetical protein